MSPVKKLSALIFSSSLVTVGRASPPRPQVFTAADMLEIVDFSGGQPIALAPDGEWVAYVLPDGDDEWNVLERRPVGYVCVQRLTDRGAESPQALSEGPQRSAFPVWSPNGEKLAFFLEDSEGGQIAVWDRQTGRIETHGDIFAGRSYLAPQWDSSGSPAGRVGSFLLPQRCGRTAALTPVRPREYHRLRPGETGLRRTKNAITSQHRSEF